MPIDPDRLQRALHDLATPPQAIGWNHEELKDVIGDLRSPAAVLVPVLPQQSGSTVLFTRRSKHLRHHAGQISFPGGRAETNDSDAIAVALRETEEEIGIPARHIKPIGYLDCCETISGFCITPVVAYLDIGSIYKMDSMEVEEIFEIPLKYFLDPNNLRRREIEFRGRARKTYEFVFDRHVIWGATAAMLVNLRDRLERVS